MENQNNEEFPEKFSDDEEEQLRIENEILRLKLKAELGGEIELIEGTNDLPPEIENLFLKNLLSFEHQYEQVEQTTIFEILDKPLFTNAEELNDDEIEHALVSVNELLKEHQIAVDFRGSYPAREQYRFITNDLFNHSTRLVKIEGMFTHYSYEEFYPNHLLDLEELTKDFISSWFNMSFEENTDIFSDELFTDQSKVVGKVTVLEKFNHIFNAYTAFEDTHYIVGETNFQLEEGGKTGLGHVEGAIKFTAILESNEKVHVEEPFKLYLQFENGSWQIFFFYWPTFNW